MCVKSIERLSYLVKTFFLALEILLINHFNFFLIIIFFFNLNLYTDNVETIMLWDSTSRGCWALMHVFKHIVRLHTSC